MTERVLRPHQFRAVTSNKRHVFLGCGVGAGKTTVSAATVIKKIAEVPNGVVPKEMAQGIIAANTYTQLRDSTMRRFYQEWRDMGIRFEPENIPKNQAFEVKIWNGDEPREILCRSLSKPDTISGLDLGFGVVDESYATEWEAIQILNDRIRAAYQPHPQVQYATTLDEMDSWMYRFFVENYDPEVMEVIYARTHDNACNLPEGYIADRKRLYDSRKYKRMVLAEWVSLTDGLVYYAFGDHNVSELAGYEPALPVWWSHDFNIGVGKPMSSVLAQIKKGPGIDGKIRPELHIFDEIVIETSDTHDAVDEFKQRMTQYEGLTEDRVYITGDAAGKARDTRSKTTDYGILKSCGFKNQRVPRSNPPVRQRHNDCNTLFKSADDDVRVKVHPRCKVTNKGFRTVSLRKGAQYLEEETYEQHVTTAATYLMSQEMPVTERVFSGGEAPF